MNPFDYFDPLARDIAGQAPTIMVLLLFIVLILVFLKKMYKS